MNVRKSSPTLPVAAIIVTYNTRTLTLAAINALLRSSVLPERIIVVDNASTDGTFEAIQARYLTVECIRFSTNEGFAKANNYALSLLTTETYAWLVNSDTEVHKDTLGVLYAYAEAHPNVGMVGPTMVYPDGSLQSVGGYFPSVINVFRYLVPFGVIFPPRIRGTFHDIALFPQPIFGEKKVDYVTGAACLLRRSALEKAGVLGEQYFMYFEETDLAWRLKKQGYVVLALRTPPVMHVYGGSYKRAHDKKRLEQFLESLVVFVKTNYTGVRRIAILFLVRLFGSFSIMLRSLKQS